MDWVRPSSHNIIRASLATTVDVFVCLFVAMPIQVVVVAVVRLFVQQSWCCEL